MEKTLGQYLSEPSIRKIAKDAVKNRDLTSEPVWNKTMDACKADFNGNIQRGLERLYAAAATNDWYYPLYTEKEIEEVPARKDVNLVWMPSDRPGADEKPFILVVPGGGFVNVWNLTEGWPIAAEFNSLGYHVFILTYQVEAEKELLKRNMEDFARALKVIADNQTHFHVQKDQYLTCGFSAGGYLVCLWDTEFGYPAFGLPKPIATFPVYPVVTLKREKRYEGGDGTRSIRLYGCDLDTALQTAYEIPEHVEYFPPCALFLSARDELVNPENSVMLHAALKEKGIPTLLEMGPSGGHGFGDGSGMCMEGWIKRGLDWVNSLPTSCDP
ncbi:MAG: prolyl oligopeptidase family serine peptidase [Clostridia bacterium]|nr:prolyl oligopeptidase family serine peptidase [Clostridia bacterium]